MPKLPPIDIPIRGQDKFTKNMAKIAAKMKRFSANMQKIGQNLTRFITLPLAGLGIAALKFSFDFNKAMANVATLIPGDIKRINELKRGVQDLAIETGKSTDDIATGLFRVISALGDTADTQKILTIAVKAGVAGNSNTGASLGLLTSIAKGYNDVTEESIAKVADLAFITNKLGDTNFEDLAGSMGKVVSMSNSMNVSQEEMFSAFASLTGVTGNANRVSTQYAGILRAMIKPTEDMKVLLKRLGFETGSAAIKQLGFMGVLKKVMAVTAGNEQKLGKLIGSEEGIVGALALGGAQAEKYAQSMVAMKNRNGDMLQAFDATQNGVNKTGAEWEKFKQLMIVTSQRIGDRLAPAFMKVINFAKPLLKKIGELSDKSLMFIIVIGAIAAVIGPVILVIATLAGIIGFVGAKVALIVVGVIAFIGVVIGLWQAFKKLNVFGKIILTLFFPFPGMIMLAVNAIKLLIAGIGKLVGTTAFRKMAAFLKALAKIGGKVFSKLFFKGDDDESAAPQKREAINREPWNPRESISDRVSSSSLEGRHNPARIDIAFKNRPEGTKIDSNPGDNIVNIDRGMAFAR